MPFIEQYLQIPPIELHAKTHAIIWTDGSCWPQHGPGGWVSKIELHVAIQAGYQFGTIYAWGQQKGLCTSPYAELKALLEGLRAIPMDVVQFDSCEIISDSEWMIRCLDGRNIRRKFLEEWNEIDLHLARFVTRTYTHIRGHQRVTDDWRVDGNVECDAIADWCRTANDISVEAFQQRGFVTFENS